MRKTLLLFDLDGTLLRSDKTISVRTLQEINRCRSMGILIGISTSRSEQNTLTFLKELDPDLLITSGGALVKKNGEYIHKACFSAEQTRNIIQTARQICGEDCEITIDTLDTHYWNYKMDPKSIDQSWGESTWTDFSDFDQESLKICVEIFDENNAHRMETELTDCDSLRFSDGCWYKYTKKGVNKERAIDEICKACGIGYENIVAFGDDYADIGMLQLAGVGVAMGNAQPAVKEAADYITATNDEDGLVEVIEKFFSEE